MEQDDTNKHFQDGWENLSQSSEESLQLVSLYHGSKGRPILQQQYSLEPDMATGWIPKLPSCPIPLTYQNSLIQAILLKIEFDSRFRIIYRGPRHINSVQLHKQNPYRWKYRQKYEVKINAIEEAVQEVGKESLQNTYRGYLERESSAQQQLLFDSDFESGNLDLAIRVKPLEFDCFMRSDTNTRGHTNWYYFTIKNGKYKGPVQLNICNITKQKNLYSRGMKPYTSCRYLDRSESREEQWKQGLCYDVQFVERLCRYGTNRTQNQLQFKYTFDEQNMEVSFAYSIPYTFTQLQNYITQLQLNPHVSITSLCQSFSGLELPLITIAKNQRLSKVNVVIAGRIHPGQTNSSHMMQGFINSLLENDTESHRLLASANFYIIPMINPDGVVAGNYRTSFSGRDLNRCFSEINQYLYPQLNGMVNLIKRLKNQRQKVEFFFDFHSHSSKKNLFCYGPEHPEGTLHFFRSRILVKTLQKQSQMFSSQQSIYKISQHKKSTARAYMLNKQKIPMTFTFEISNGIYSLSKDTQICYDQKSLHQAGKIVMSGLSEYFNHYHRDIAQQPKLKLIKFKDERLSFSINQKNFYHFRKTVGHHRSLQGSHSKQNQISTLISQILEEKPIYQKENQQKSDSESSNEDIRQDQLNNLFSIRQNYKLKQQSSKAIRISNQKRSDKLSLKKIKSRMDILKPSISTTVFGTRDLNYDHNTSKSTLQRYRKSRVTYEETHPRTAKKVFESAFESKKPLKQKRFPILF